MTETQFQALSKLRGAHVGTKTYNAMHDVFVNGVSQRVAANTHGISANTLAASCWRMRRIIALVHTAVTGQEHKMLTREAAQDAD